MKTKTAFAAALLPLLPFALSAQINLRQFYSASVRESKNVPTSVESVLVVTEVANGIAKTNLTMVLEPGAYQSYQWVSGPQVCDQNGCYNTSEIVWSPKKEEIDSIEISAHFTLPTDWVVKEMWLWVEGQKVRAEIQDRALARGQYEQIVNRRRDPCLVEFWGNGSYNLRIFPAESNAARKIELEFQHTFDDDSASLVTASLPLVFDTTQSYYYVSPDQKRPIGYMRAVLKSGDGATYDFAMPGLGGGRFSAVPLTLEKSAIEKLAAGTISKADPSGSSEYLWTGEDKNNHLAVGFSLMLSDSTVTLEPEPETRIIVLDMRQEWWDQDVYYGTMYEYAYGSQYDPGWIGATEPVNIWKRAQKYAVLCVKNYVASNQKFNLVINGEPLFAGPVSPTAFNLAQAFAAIASAKPNPAASTNAAMKIALDEAAGDIVILISDLYRPSNYVRYIYDATNAYKGSEISPQGEAFDRLIDTLGALVESSGVTLFTIEDEYALSNIAGLSGGYRLASLRYTYYYDYRICLVDGTQKYVPNLPRLFMDERYGRGISGVTVTSPQASDIVTTLDGYSYWWWDGPVVMADASGGTVEPVLRKRSAMVLPQYYGNKRLLRVAGIWPVGPIGTPTFTITGKMGGLKFTKKVSCYAQNVGDLSTDNVQWAFRRAEQLGNEYWYDSADVIKQIGKDYHIVTRQTSLLALEPGTEMWEDTAAPENTTTESGAATSDAQFSAAPDASRGTGYSLDDVTLDELIEGELPAVHGGLSKARKAMAVKVKNADLILFIPAQCAGSGLTLKLFDLSGRLVGVRDLGAVETARGSFVWNLKAHGLKLGSGYYVLSVAGAYGEKQFRVPFVR